MASVVERVTGDGPIVVDIVGGRTLPRILDEQAALIGERRFLDGFEMAYSYGQTARSARALAEEIVGIGLQRGSRVALVAPLSYRTVIAQLAMFYAGVVVVPINPAFTTEEVRRVLTLLDCSALVTHSTEQGDLRFADCRESLSEAAQHLVIVWPSRADITPRVVGGAKSFEIPYVGQGAVTAPNLPMLTPEDPAVIYLTSGTTGQPKGVVYTHGNLVHGAEVVIKQYAVRDGETYLAHFPLFHMNGAVTQLNPMLMSGGRFYICEKFSASGFTRELVESNATMTHLNATHLRILLRNVPTYEEAENNLRLVAFGLNVTEAEMIEFEDRFDVRLVQHFGLSESTGIVTADAPFGRRRMGSLGRPCLEYEVRVIGLDGLPAAPGVTGELEVSSASRHGLMLGYYGDPAGTAEVLRDEGSKLRTGDLGHVDAEGFIWYDGRERDAVKRAGETIAPAEIEFVLTSCDGVREAAVIGVPDDILGEIVVAYVAVGDGAHVNEATLTEHCMSHLAKFKIPARFEFVSDLPHNEIGKTDKKRLRMMAARGADYV